MEWAITAYNAGDFYSRASCEARRKEFFNVTLEEIISTHAPHARRDKMIICDIMCLNVFLLTRLMRGATKALKTARSFLRISTHAPHARRDFKIL